MALQFTFYATDKFGERLLLDFRLEPDLSVEEAGDKVESMMRNTTFTEGRADHCIIKDQQGNTVREVVLLADRTSSWGVQL
jgi:hypothetical protein